MNPFILMRRCVERLVILAVLGLACPSSHTAEPHPPEPGSILWQHPLEQAASSIALGVDGRFYATTGDRLLAFATDGTPLWEHRSDGWPFVNPPMITDDGLVLVATERSWIVEGSQQLQAVGPDGQVVWQLADVQMSRLPALMPGGDLLLAAAFPEDVTAIHRLDPRGDMIWRSDGSPYPFGAPSVRGDGVVSFPGGLALRPDGSTLWDLHHPVVTSTAAVGRDGTMYFGSSQVPAGSNATGSLVARGTDGVIRWQYPSSVVGSSPAILADDSIVFGTRNGRLVRVSKDGNLLWELGLGAAVVSTPAVTADGLIWCGTEGGRFYALDAEDATARWDLDLGGAIRSSPAVGPDGRVYITAEGAGLFIIQGAAPPVDSPWPMYRCNAARQARSEVTALEPESPTGVTAEEGFERGAVTLTWAPATWAESYEVWRGSGQGEEEMTLLVEGLIGATRFADRKAGFEQTHSYRIRARNALGSSSFSEPIECSQQTRRWTLGFNGQIVMPPALGEDGVLRVLVQPHDAPATRRVTAVDSAGQILWETETGLVVDGPLLSADGTAYLVTQEAVVAIDAGGVVRWTRALPPETALSYPLPGASVWTGDGELVVGTQFNRLHWIDSEGSLIRTVNTSMQAFPELVGTTDGGLFIVDFYGIASMFERNGLPRWTVSLPRGLGVLAAGLDGDVFWAGGGELIAKAASGTMNWSYRYGVGPAQALTPTVGPDGTVYLVHPPYWMHAVNPDGSQRWSAKYGQFTSSATLCGDGTILVYRMGRLTAYDPDARPLWDASISLGSETSIPGPLSPLIAPDGTIFGCSATHVVCLVGTGPPATPGWPMARRDARQSGNASGPAPVPAPLMDVAPSEGTSVNHVRLGWAPNADRAWVEIWRAAEDDLASATQVGTVDPGTFEYFDQDIPPGAGYFYWLRARNEAGSTPFTEALRAYAATIAWRLWDYDAGSDLSAPALGLAGHLHVATADGQLLAVRESELAWHFGELAPPLFGPVVALDGTVFVHNEAELAAVRPDGTLRWQRALSGGRSTPMTVGWDGALHLVEQQGLTAIDADGAIRWEVALDFASSAHAMLGADDRLRLSDGNHVKVLRPNGTLDTTLTGTASGPMALALDGTLFFGLSTHKLAAVRPDGTVLFHFGYTMFRQPPVNEPALGPNQRAFVTRAEPWIKRTHAVDGQGQALWEYPSHATGLVADAEGGLIFTHPDHVTALQPDGSLRWDYHVPGSVPSPPFLTDDGLLCFTAGQRLVALQTDLRPAPSGWAMWRSDPQRSGRTTAGIRILGWRPAESGSWELLFVGQPDAIHWIEHTPDLEHWSVVAECVALPGTTPVALSSRTHPSFGFFRIRRE